MHIASMLLQSVFSPCATHLQAYMGLTKVTALLNSPLYVGSIHVHPGYDNPNHIDFNNDIALLKLKEPLTFNTNVMPVCLPPEDATYETGLMG